MSVHSFDIKIATELNVNAAILYQNIKFWCEKNKANNKNFYDGAYWTYNSTKAFKELFPYLGESQIKSALKLLEDKGYISTGNYNKIPYDKTKWFCDNHLLLPLAKIANGSVENSQPIPDNKPDNNNAPAKNAGCEMVFPEEAFNELWKDYSLTFLKLQGRRGGSKEKARKSYKELLKVLKLNPSEIYKYVESHCELKIGHQDLERLLRPSNYKQWIEDNK